MKLKLTFSQFFLSILFIHGRVLATCNNGDDRQMWKGVSRTRTPLIVWLCGGICARMMGFPSKRNGEVNSEISLIKAKNTLAVRYFSNLPFSHSTTLFPLLRIWISLTVSILLLSLLAGPGSFVCVFVAVVKILWRKTAAIEVRSSSPLYCFWILGNFEFHSLRWKKDAKKDKFSHWNQTPGCTFAWHQSQS